MPNMPWTPTWSWHAKIWGVLVGVCVGVLAVLWYVTNRLPPPFNPYRPQLVEKAPAVSSVQQDTL